MRVCAVHRCFQFLPRTRDLPLLAGYVVCVGAGVTTFGGIFYAISFRSLRFTAWALNEMAIVLAIKGHTNSLRVGGSFLIVILGNRVAAKRSSL